MVSYIDRPGWTGLDVPGGRLPAGGRRFMIEDLDPDTHEASEVGTDTEALR